MPPSRSTNTATAFPHCAVSSSFWVRISTHHWHYGGRPSPSLPSNLPALFGLIHMVSLYYPLQRLCSSPEATAGIHNNRGAKGSPEPIASPQQILVSGKENQLSWPSPWLSSRTTASASCWHALWEGHMEWKTALWVWAACRPHKAKTQSFPQGQSQHVHCGSGPHVNLGQN